MRLNVARPIAATATGATVDRAWIETEPLALRDTVQQLEGADGRPMLFDVATGRYVAISKAGSAVLGLLDGVTTGRELIGHLVTRVPGDSTRIEEAVLRFLGELRQAGVMSTAPSSPRAGTGAFAGSLRRRTPRWPLTKGFHRALEPVAARLRAVPLRLLFPVCALVLASAAVVAGVALTRHPFGLHYTHWIWAAMVILVLQIAVHESSHALVCQYLGVPVREAGITLMLFVMPVAYVDRTDCYRVRSRWSRVLIALAGPLSDVVWAGASALALLTTRGVPAHVALPLLQMQTLLMIVNLNPLLPSDGYHALESAMGSMNLRGRSFGYLIHVVTRSELPSHLRATGVGRRAGYLFFGLICLAYGVVMAVLILLSWGRLLMSVVA